jgi:predicted CXXCH cytochrome family protein
LLGIAQRNAKTRFAGCAPLGILLCVIPLNARGQEFDTAILGTPARSATILDQIGRPQERRTFQALYNRGDPRRRLKAAQAFLTDYPDSWMLAEVYEIAAKACLDQGDQPKAIAYAKESLRLLPENPLLLVPIAHAQVEQGLLRDGETSARDALEYLDRFARPSSISESRWPVVRAQLRGSSFYALGKIRLAQGLGATGDERRGQLQAAAADLTGAAQLDTKNGGITYLLGLTDLALNDPDSAARAFAAAARLPGAQQAKAQAKLGELHLNAADFRPLETRPADPPAPSSSPDEYAGSQACRTCHPGQHTAWQQTGMASMLRPYQPENVFGDFVNQMQFEDNSGSIVARMWIEKNRHYFATRGDGGAWQLYPVDYTIGSKWQQAYATRLADGQIQVFPIQYNKLKGTWVNYWKIIDPPGSERSDPGLFHRMGSGTNYQTNCAPCHTSQLHARNPHWQDTRALVFREPGVNCEMCHGPSARHVDAMTAGRPYSKAPVDPPVDFAKLDNRRFVAICAQCHMQSAVREKGPKGEWNYSESGNSFLPRYSSRPFVDFSRRAFYKDGRFRETTFIAEAFMRSACYRKGQAQCGNCHEPHPADAAANPTSLKHRDDPDQMCLPCHAAYAGRIEAHTHHPVSSEASRCVSCHMPRIMNSLLFQARTHQIDDIPRADMTLRFGPQESPNACLSCHREKDATWVDSRLRSWS